MMEEAIKKEENKVKLELKLDPSADDVPAQISAVNDDQIQFDRQCTELARLLRTASHTIIYCGAGISTSAQIPDYRGPNGIWTLRNAGKPIEPFNILRAEPTYTHLAIRELVDKGFIKFIVSQNCDGLHLRSGLSPDALSELHGNALIETCSKCETVVRRGFDVTIKNANAATRPPTENKDSENDPKSAGKVRRSVHETDRRCSTCNASMMDTLVRFGERIPLGSEVHRFEEALDHASRADHILCIGTSLVVLRAYKRLWPNSRLRNAKRSLSLARKKQKQASVANKPPSNCTFLSIVNLQKTAKDSQATLRIAGQCDDVMRRVLQLLDISVRPYSRAEDPYLNNVSPAPAVADADADAKLQDAEVKREVCAAESESNSDSNPGEIGIGIGIGMGISTWGIRAQRPKKRRFAMLGRSRRRAAKRSKPASIPESQEMQLPSTSISLSPAL